MAIPTVPPGLSPTSAGIWRALTTQHRSEAHELVTFERALTWFDLSDRWLAEAARAAGRAAPAGRVMGWVAAMCISPPTTCVMPS